MSDETRELRERVACLEARLRSQVDYAIWLQRAIEYHCRREKIPAWIRIHSPHLAEQLDADLAGPRGATVYGDLCRVSAPDGAEIVFHRTDRGLTAFATRRPGNVPEVTVELDVPPARFLRDWLADQVR